MDIDNLINIGIYLCACGVLIVAAMELAFNHNPKEKDHDQH